MVRAAFEAGRSALIPVASPGMTSIRRTAAVRLPPAPKPQALKGKVSLKQVATGSKSERKSLVLQAGGKTIRLERLGGNPFELDAKEKSLVGKNVELEGFFVSETLFRFTSATLPKH